MAKQHKLDFEAAAEQLHELIRICDAGDLAAIYENAFGAVKSCEESSEGDYFIIEYEDGLDPDANRPEVGKLDCQYCGQLNCDYDCDESQAAKKAGLL